MTEMSIVYISQQAKIPRYKSPFSGAGQQKKTQLRSSCFSYIRYLLEQSRIKLKISANQVPVVV